MILTCTCGESYCETCDLPNGMCKECRKPLCPYCQTEAVHRYRGVCPTCISPPTKDDRDLDVTPQAQGPAHPYCQAGHLLDEKNTVMWRGNACCVLCNQANRRAKRAEVREWRGKNG